MPTVSEHETFIHKILHAMNEEISCYWRIALDREFVEDPDTPWPSDSSESESESESPSSCSSSSSSNESSSSSDVLMSVDGADTDEEHTIAMDMAADLLQVIADMCVLDPPPSFQVFSTGFSPH
jgi:hypothetical protein